MGGIPGGVNVTSEGGIQEGEDSQRGKVYQEWGDSWRRNIPGGGKITRERPYQEGKT